MLKRSRNGLRQDELPCSRGYLQPSPHFPGQIANDLVRGGGEAVRQADTFGVEARRRTPALLWREIRADRLEVVVLGDLFAAGEIEDEAERDAAKAAAFKALATLLRYQA